MHQPMQSSIFFFGPGDWRLEHDPKWTSQNEIYFTLAYLGQRASANKDTETNNSTSKFSFHAELSLLASNGSVFLTRGKNIFI